MNKIAFIGDVHGKFDKLQKTLRQNARIVGMERVIQVGDLGMGFAWTQVHGVYQCKDSSRRFPPNFSFIRGNHDSPSVCRNHPAYLGDWGFRDGIFFVGGGFSIDRNQRVEGRDWWADEELSISALNEAITKYEWVKPQIMVTHECPSRVTHSMFGIPSNESSRTSQALEAMLDIHQPALWIFGHHHWSKTAHIQGTEFRCLNELETFFVDKSASSVIE